MTSTSNSNSSSLSSTTSSSSSTSTGVTDINNSTDSNNRSTNRVVNMSGDGNSNDTPPLESSTPNNVELEYKKITGDRNGWQRLYQVCLVKFFKEIIYRIVFLLVNGLRKP